MEIFKKIAPLKAFLKEFRTVGDTIGLVPTMGALHNGHLSLIDTSKSQNSLTVCSIYVNPTQFNNPVDLQKYPRNLEEDVKLLQKVGCDVVFCPSNEEMYTGQASLKFDFGALDKVMEGKFRPGHFSGVALVVSKFFNIVNPDRAYFGQKDWQQFAIIQQVVEELKFGLTLHSVPTLREADGLAMSSRNLRLNEQERLKATIFHQSLLAAQENLRQGRKITDAKKLVEEMIKKVPGVTLEYFEVADSKNLNVLEFVNEAEKPILCIAGYVGDVRLIDNMFLK
ncbi:pantoate--beta-alanine ligase [Chryseolinea sp. H1M3-3]|uniref:pantoate--beta-alanine ligase n=1 Tax=Chryseolinea sp. H1M3-3 TaxID=3034144 RepID=UPI0023EABE45|nr:pantoate--beta-alanine ligase [Chryseolinea sp. H1M3-3]